MFDTPPETHDQHAIGPCDSKIILGSATWKRTRFRAGSWQPPCSSSNEYTCIPCNSYAHCASVLAKVRRRLHASNVWGSGFCSFCPRIANRKGRALRTHPLSGRSIQCKICKSRWINYFTVSSFRAADKGGWRAQCMFAENVMENGAWSGAVGTCWWLFSLACLLCLLLPLFLVQIIMVWFCVIGC